AAKASFRAKLQEIGLSDAWEGVEKRFAVGTTHMGVVKSIKEFGVFVELAPGIDGLIPRNSVDRRRQVNLSRGKTVKVRVREVSERDFRMGLDLVDIDGKGPRKGTRNAL